MITDKETALKTAELLLQINAIKLQPKKPFLWSSGWKSPIYCDNRIALSYPSIRNYLRERLADQIEGLYGKPDVIAAVATGAIGLGVLAASAMNLPFVYVRPQAKGHGRQNQVEGSLEKDQTVVVIEDLVSTGRSSLQAVQALRAAGATVKGMVAVFTYGFDVARENFEKAGVELHTLSDYETLIQQAEKTSYISSEDVKTLREWQKAPAQWAVDNGQ